MWTSRHAITAAAAVAALMIAGCAPAGQGDTDVLAAVEPTEPAERAVDYVGELIMEPASGPAGTEVTLRGAGLPEQASMDVVWVTVDCNWELRGEQREDYHGRACSPREVPLRAVDTDASGGFTAGFTVPDDYGFAHDVLVIDTDGVVRNKALFNVEMQVSVTPAEGAVGTPITIEVKGMGWQTLEDTRTILYDNNYVGFMSAVTTRGTARAVIPATGAPGPHRIEINRGAYTFPYLNPGQSPRPDIPTFDAVFTVIDGDPVLPPPIEEQNPQAVARVTGGLAGDGPAITTDVASGPVGTPFTITGAGFAGATDLELRWFRIVGNRVGGQGWEERAVVLGEVTTAADGTFAAAQVIPGDVGGPHRIEAVAGDATLAETTVSITPQADPIPTRVRWGDDVSIHLTGVGWTETANIYTLVYDNAYVGYACGFNTQGDVLIPLTATGAPGWHFIDLYPAIYKGKETPGRDNFRIPQLTYADDHPGEDLPAFRYAFYIEP
jgi:hypothetical protein